MRSPLLPLIILAAHTAADQAPITIDGRFDDWANVPVARTDPEGDGAASLDLVRLSIADDDRFLFLRIETAQDFDLSEQNSLRLYLDTDDNPDTGADVGGVGAELEWRFGSRIGFYFGTASFESLGQQDIRFRGAPTVTAREFEIAIALDTIPDGVNPLFPGSRIRVYLEDPLSGDALPDAGATLTYTLGQGDTPPVEPRSLGRTEPADLRVMTHNVLRDNLFVPFFTDSFERLYTAAAPDILHLQEIYGSSADQTRDLVAPWLEAAGLGAEWHAARVNDCITVSRFPVLGAWPIDANLAVLLDTTASIGTPMLCVNAHLPCCGNDAGRQRESDAIIAFIREAYTPGGDLSLEPTVPVMITGDLNLVGDARQLETLLTGDIADEQRYGPDHAPDPDGTPLANIISRQTGKRMGYTWRDDTSSFWPGQLDYLIYSDSSLILKHDFIVYTPEMSPDALQANGLLEDDSRRSDHLVFVADFEARCRADLTRDGRLDLADLTAFITGFTTQQPTADFAPPTGVLDLADLTAFVAQFLEGCATGG